MAWWMLMFVCLCMIQEHSHGNNVKVTTLATETGIILNHMVLDEDTNTIFVAGTNSLFQLDSNLTVTYNISTGPKNDSIKCNIKNLKSGCSFQLSPTNNYNKILLLHTTNGVKKLVLCGSLFQGQCELRNVSSINSSQPYDIEVASNEKYTSSVGFITYSTEIHESIYVATEFTTFKKDDIPVDYQYREKIPIVSLRKLHSEGDAFEIRGKVLLADDFRKPNLFHYVTGFTSGNYSYFIFNEYVNSKWISKIVHMCNEDMELKTFVEVPLKCQSKNDLGKVEEFNSVNASKLVKPGNNLFSALRKDLPDLAREEDILVGLFRNGGGNSSVCLFSMSEIRNKVVENIKACFKADTRNSAFKKYADGNNCEKTFPGVDEIPDNDFLCGVALDYNIKVRVAGVISAESTAAAVFTDTDLTSISLTTTTDFTVAFIGTRTGTIKKLILESATKAVVYGTDIILDSSSPISQDTAFDSTQMVLYAMSEKKIAKIPVQNCEQYTTCSECLSSQDPYCGWCTLNHKCSLKSACDNPTDSRWQNGPERNCIAILNVSPPMASATENITLYLIVYDLPRDSTYQCDYRFDDVSEKVPADFWSSGIKCTTPDVPRLGVTFDQRKGYKNISLGVYSVETKKVVVSKPYTIYSCGSFKRCSDCVDNVFYCDWCITENRCQFNSGKCSNIVYSRNDTYTYIKINGSYIDEQDIQEYRYDNSGKTGPTFCPKVDSSPTIFIPRGIEKTITVQGMNFPASSDYSGRITTPSGSSPTFTGSRNSDSELTFTIPKIYDDLSATNGQFNANFAIFWKGNFQIESEGLQLTLFSCESQARGDCSFCKSLNPDMKCSWCNEQGEGKCLYNRDCTQPNCAAPNITKVSPITGHYLGGTKVTITGINLGVTFTDIENTVFIVDTKCNPIQELYQPSKRIVCRLGNKGVEANGFVTIMGHQITGKAYTFYYMKPAISTIFPTYKAKSGGGSVTLSGRNLQIGNLITVYFGNKTSQILSKMSSEVVCKVPAGEVGNITMSAEIDSNKVEQTVDTFTYVNDPNITGIQPRVSFSSGGRRITVHGTDLTGVDTPTMFYYYDGGRRSPSVKCKVTNNTLMHCSSPANMSTVVASVTRMKRAAGQSTVQLAFSMDDVQSVQNLSSSFPEVQSTLTFVLDPEVKDFEESDRVKAYSEVLTIRGTRLNVAADQSDVSVNIGLGICNVTNLASNEIYCTPPVDQPEVDTDNEDQHSEGIPQVVVVIGNFKKQVGYLRYKEAKATDPIKYVLPSIIGFAVLVVIVVIVTCYKYRKQKKESQREYQQMQLQLDNLESTVRNECKQAFAELQTDMTDLTYDLEGSKKPYYSYDDYTFRVLFPGMVDHVILRPVQKNGNVDRHPDVAITHFKQLLNNKQFLLMFIRTLEKQKNFSIRDKSNVASLLVILFENNMEYVTDILKALMLDLIEKSIENKRPKLMMRRTESVVEKLLANWLSLCMYQYLCDAAGSSLYTLYQAIKVQVEKGPVDCITGEARYSLSEDRLLRTEKLLDYTVLNIWVDYEGKTRTKCRILDCDTISQGKEKMIETICRNVPYTMRPVASDLDLEWTQIGKILSDEDSSTPKIDGWKQYNTFKYYKVEDGAEMVLTPHQQCRTLPRSPNGSIHSSGFAFTVNREAQPITRTESEVGTKYWHLVKQDDTNTGIKLSSEVYLTRLLATKGTLKKYIDDFFSTLLTADDNLPPVIKCLFDFLDEAALIHAVEPDVVYTWKCNSLLLRFWVNIIKNPDFVYDINKTNIVDSCLSVVAQTFMDSCSTSDHHLGKDSPSNKLLFAKDIPQYKQLVEKYFQDIKSMPAISDQDLNAYLAEVSRMSTDYFTKENALHELYNYVHEYSNAINESLEEDQASSAQQLPAKLGHVITSMEGPQSSKPAFV